MFISIYQIDTNKAMYTRFADQVNPYGITRQQDIEGHHQAQEKLYSNLPFSNGVYVISNAAFTAFCTLKRSSKYSYVHNKPIVCPIYEIKWGLFDRAKSTLKMLLAFQTHLKGV